MDANGSRFRDSSCFVTTTRLATLGSFVLVRPGRWIKTALLLLCVVSFLFVGSAFAIEKKTGVKDASKEPVSVAKVVTTEAKKKAAALNAPPKKEMPEWEKKLDIWAGEKIVKPLGKILSFPIYTLNKEGASPTEIPLIVVWLMVGAFFLTFRMGLMNLRGFAHAIRITKGDYDNPEDEGEVSHFQALTSALSATVGLGNIAGVAIAVGLGGPGAIFWMIVAGFVGMTSKLVESTLAQMYRRVDSDGRVSGGPMRYLYDGLSEMGLGGLGRVLAILFAVLCIGGSFGGGCAFQVNQSLDLVKEQPIFSWLVGREYIYGIVMAVCVGAVILGGIKRIASTAEKVVPLMCVIYILASCVILFQNYDQIGWAINEIWTQAFNVNSAYGGIIGVMVVGIKRAAFSNEAGVGSAAIAHSAAKTKYPVREGMVAMLGPFIDTVVICTMTGLVIIITKVYDAEIHPELHHLITGNKGAVLTSKAFGTCAEWFPTILAICSMLFAYSTIISWSYYGERCFTYLFGQKSSLIYRLLYLVCVFLGSIVSATNILEFSDMMILAMAFPNMLGLVLLSGKVRAAIRVYWATYKAGEFKKYD